MQLTLTPDILDTFAQQLAKNPQLARTLAQQLLATTDKLAMANYLLADGVALKLLAERLKSKPKKTLPEIAGLAVASDDAPTGKPKTRGRRRGSGARAPRGRQARPAAKATAPGRPRRRARLTPRQAAGLKQRVVAFLKANPGSTRKQIEAEVKFPSAAVYTRLMKELKAERLVVQKGQRGKATYRAKG